MLRSSAYCSIGAYPGLRITVRALVISLITRLAAPKSSSNGLPSVNMRMLSGEMSR